jgi:hypothetical protein
MNLQFLVGSLYKSFKGKSGIVSTHNFWLSYVHNLVVFVQKDTSELW